MRRKEDLHRYSFNDWTIFRFVCTILSLVQRQTRTGYNGHRLSSAYATATQHRSHIFIMTKAFALAIIRYVPTRQLEGIERLTENRCWKGVVVFWVDFFIITFQLSSEVGGKNPTSGLRSALKTLLRRWSRHPRKHCSGPANKWKCN